ncbi:MAG: MBL fold metallo-hydrolase [Chloroflexota bacterium]|nr:MBL fold metallo-hydrolase [Chloroflexota bacterium]
MPREVSMGISTVTPEITFLHLDTPIAGYQRFIGSYLLCGQRKAIVECGPRAALPSLLGALAAAGVNTDDIDYVILTHIHMDHAGGIGAAIRQMSRARVVAHPRAVPHLVDPGALWEASQKQLGPLAHLYGEIEPVPPDRLVAAHDLMELDLGPGLDLQVHLTPGHASHHLSIFERTRAVLLAGEAAGVCIDGSTRPSTPHPFRLSQALSSIERLIALEPQVLCYGHIGFHPDATGRLEAMRDRLLAWHELVTRAATAGRDPEAILPLLKESDRGLDYLDALDSDELERERTLILNSIAGLAQCGP